MSDSDTKILRRNDLAIFNSETMDDISEASELMSADDIESYVALLQDAAGSGNPMVSDAEYDAYRSLLSDLKPDSYVLKRNWETANEPLESIDEILKEHPMYSIKTIAKKEDNSAFMLATKDLSTDWIASIKLNGHGVRAVYSYGELVYGTTRGRTTKGRDITRHLKATLPNTVPAWSGIRLLEVRGEMLVSLDTFSAVGGDLKTPLSAVTSFLRDSATEEELCHLSCVCYRIFPCHDSPLQFTKVSDQFTELERNGFETPNAKLYNGVSGTNYDKVFDTCLAEFGALKETNQLKYYTDGIVVSVDDLGLLGQLGTDTTGNALIGNFAIKMGCWESNIYFSTIDHIEFMYGKRFITPKAIIKPVQTALGAVVTTVPLYNVGVMHDYGLVPNARIYFKFGGEQGVTLCDSMGTTIGERAGRGVGV